MDTKGPISPSSQGNSDICVIIGAFSNFVSTNSDLHLSSNNAVQTCSIIRLLNLAHLNIWSPYEVIIILFETWLIFALSLLLTIFHVLHVLLGQMVWSKSKIVILELISAYFYKIILLIGQFKLKCMLTLTTLLLFLDSNSIHMKLFLTHILVFH